MNITIQVIVFDSMPPKTISPLSASIKKLTKRTVTNWCVVLPLITKYLDYNACVNISKVSTEWKKYVPTTKLVIKAAESIYGRKRFCDRHKFLAQCQDLILSLQQEVVIYKDSICTSCIEYINRVLLRYQVSSATFACAAHIVVQAMSHFEKTKQHEHSVLFHDILICNHILLGAGAILIASKFYDTKALTVAQILIGNRNIINSEDVLLAEELILQMLPNWIETNEVIFNS